MSRSELMQPLSLTSVRETISHKTQHHSGCEHVVLHEQDSFGTGVVLLILLKKEKLLFTISLFVCCK